MNKNNKKIPVIILLGGKGSRFSSYRDLPKQLMKLGKDNILIEILKNFKKNGINYFILPLGYKNKHFLKFFSSKKNLFKYNINIVKNPRLEKINESKINVKLFNAGNTSSKLERIYKSLAYFKEDNFIVTYGDGIANINLKKLVNIYFKEKNKVLLTSFRAFSQYGHVISDKKNNVINFIEKPQMKYPINVGFYIISKKIFLSNFKKNYELENDFIPILVKKRILKNFNHVGYFYSVDDKKDLVKAREKFRNKL
tara:strand:- start:2282 stop:3043 length:762 start_codon:yes stop_codon:yes gene_type:complete